MEWIMVATFRQLPDSQVQINQIVIAKYELEFAPYVPFNKIIKAVQFLYWTPFKFLIVQ